MTLLRMQYLSNESLLRVEALSTAKTVVETKV